MSQTVPVMPTSGARAKTPPSNAPLPQVAWSPTVTVQGSRPGTADAGMLRPGSVPQAAGSTQHLYEDILLSATALGGMGASGLLPPGELQSRTAELHFKVDELEKDLRSVQCLVCLSRGAPAHMQTGYLHVICKPSIMLRYCKRCCWCDWNASKLQFLQCLCFAVQQHGAVQD